MSRRAATFTQADIARVLRAAKQVGAVTAEVKVGDTTVTVSLNDKRIDEQRIIDL